MPFPYRLGCDPTADPAAVVRGDRYRITVLTDGLLRLEYADDGVFEDRASTFAVHRRLPVPDFRVLESGGHLEIVTSRFRLTYDRGRFSTSGLSVAVRGGITAYHSVWRFGQEPPNLGGTARTLDNTDGPIPLEPGVISRAGVAVIDDSSSFVFDDEGWVAADSIDRTDLYVFAYGHDYTAALRALYAVSGPVPVVPRFALGNWWSRHHRYTTESYLALMTRFRQQGIPFSVSVVDMDWHLTDVDPAHGSGWTGYTWNRELFPDPEKLLDWLHDNGLRVTLNVHPADGVRAFEEAYPAMAAALGRDPADGEPIAFDVTDREFLAAYFEVLHRGLERDGVDFWWLDWQSGPYSRVAGIDPLWMLNHFHYLDNARDGRRALTFSRYAGPGSHRYPVGFSGDTVISWASLAFQPHFTATASNIGYGWWSHDIGGHFFGTRDDELAVRWVQFGAFSPILRLHSAKNPFITKEPWSFPAHVEQVMTAFLRLRHRLVPYLHTMNHRAAADGLPLVLPMYYRSPGADEAYQVPNQYQFGTELVVAAITEPADRRTGLGRVKAWLPEGTWVDVFTDLVYDGGRTIHLHRDLTGIPVLAPAGAIVVLDGAAVPGNAPVHPGHLELLVVAGADGAFELIEDDGTTTGDPARTRIGFHQDDGTLVVEPVRGAAGVVPAARRWTVTFPALLAGDPVATADGVPVPAQVTRDGTRTSITVDDVPVIATLRVEIGAGPRLGRNDVAGRLFTLLDRAQIEYRTKTLVLEAATGPGPVALRLSRLQALDLDRELAGAVGEILLARADDVPL
ncbi:alpha-glucosidase (family GH31 glycosyl hydrolase) [Actinoplanes octamycinicus]|uniref:Alpha-glucosidase (Family GH31 glycosyl hydrolase) n=1 Tax=Actinoplanes octamycinicus TaxID=135948 RepID=A0A7W7M9B7_9ACTN|nr:TIM-barrel domain-containing protein [Actinoplanes octamycinicus]MBB4741782.1 alpha-glucosidase (family GH31 glycosyl hydrolase) [Actinoplanes octamycinicus]GIE57340.1 alpha-glucosidase [Actinoplanes octamycinicus]